MYGVVKSFSHFCNESARRKELNQPSFMDIDALKNPPPLPDGESVKKSKVIGIAFRYVFIM